MNANKSTTTLADLKELDSAIDKEIEQFLQDLSGCISETLEKEQQRIQDAVRKNLEFQNSLLPIQEKTKQLRSQADILNKENESLTSTLQLQQNSLDGIQSENINNRDIEFETQENELKIAIKKEVNESKIIEQKILEQEIKFVTWTDQIEAFAEPYRQYFGLGLSNPSENKLKIEIKSKGITNEQPFFIILSFTQGVVSVTDYAFIDSFIQQQINLFQVTKNIRGLINSIWNHLQSPNSSNLIQQQQQQCVQLESQ